MDTQVFPVSHLTGYIRDLLENDSNLMDIWVTGEVSNLARPGSGHSYFSLREGDSTLRCAMFKYSGMGAELLREGDSIIVHGKVSVYPQRGDLQLVVDLVQPEGTGELQLKFEQLRARLDQEGLFDPSRKRELPKFPVKVAVVTSESGAVWHDIVDVFQRRYPLAELVLFPTSVQGDSAVPEIVSSFTKLNIHTGIDVVILARGGGSKEDLSVFNEEDLARAVFSSNYPVISAIGHETDTTIVDLVADVRAPTPSAAAEIAAPNLVEILDSININFQRFNIEIDRITKSAKELVSLQNARISDLLPDFVSLRMRIDDWLRVSANEIDSLRKNIDINVQGLAKRLTSLSPAGTMQRGYAVVQDHETNELITDSSVLSENDKTRIHLAQGAFIASVSSVLEVKNE
ncbi:MAG: exodeoxyribonuclease VII large subunit [Dehalococcoidia bacterium]|nr:exodeoxyribonuclease VII large subunit [Dehalococcoidia bacterium]MQG15571.1 exodeoxyribonuclease VII large subunit [SAR202 cluster bacterium]|tara:strand:+ start:2772 stop:3980 length:1209 start_codon:yes stop_codon:yes gene_type:complete